MVPRTRICSGDRPARGLDELGEEGDEEDRDLGIEELDEHALEEELRAAVDHDLLRLLALEQLARAEVEQVGRSGVPDDGEGGGRGGDQPRQAGGGGERIRERAGLDAEHRHDAAQHPLEAASTARSTPRSWWPMWPSSSRGAAFSTRTRSAPTPALTTSSVCRCPRSASRSTPRRHQHPGPARYRAHHALRPRLRHLVDDRRMARRSAPAGRASAAACAGASGPAAPRA